MTRLLPTLAATALLALPLAAAAQNVELQVIGRGAVTDISADGRVATGMANGDFVTFRWTAATGLQRLGRGTYGPLRGRVSGQPGISDDGRTIAATILDDSGEYGTQGLWTTTGGWRQLGPLPADGGVLDAETSSVWGLSRNGRVVTGLYWRPGQPGGLAHGSAWRAPTGIVGLDTGGGSARVDDANADGRVLVGWEEDPVNGSRLAAVWRDGVRSFLDDTALPGEAASVSADGRVIVGQAYADTLERSEAAIWTWDGSRWVRRLLGVLPGTKPGGYSYAQAVSDDGRIVVGFTRKRFNFFESDAFIWTEETGMVDMMAFLAARGVDLGTRFKINFLPAITGRGDVIAAVGTDLAPPYTQRSLLIKLSRPEEAAVSR